MHIEKPVVILLRHTPEPERAVAAAARLCYSNSGIRELQEALSEEQTARLVKVCVSQGHHSVLEHASFTFGIEGVSRVMTHQLVRHRIASYSQQSQRYVRFDDAGFVIPPEVAANERLEAAYREALRRAEEGYLALLREGVKAEDARYLLPGAAATKITVTMNARELRHFFRLRCCNRAHWEIRGVAVEMLKLAMKAAPLLFSDCGPACLNGPCPEGKMTCGRMAEVREFFAGLAREAGGKG